MRPKLLIIATIVLMLTLVRWASAQSVGSGVTMVPMGGPGAVIVGPGSNPNNNNGIIPDSINPLKYGVKANPRADSTCTITNANPGTISACATLNLTAADTGKLVRVVNTNANPSNLFTGCVLNGATGTLGTLVASVCTSAAYTGLTTSNVFVQVATDDTVAMQSAINALYATTNTVIRGLTLLSPNRCIMISDTLHIYNKSGQWVGHGMQADGFTASSTPGTCIIWAGPRGHPIIDMKGSFGFQLSNMALLGNTNPANKPSACVDLIQPSSGFKAQNSADTIANVTCNNWNGSDPDTGGSFPASTPLATASTYCVMTDPTDNGNNERHILDHVMCGYTDVCFAQLIQQSANIDVRTSSCFRAGGFVHVPVGGELNLEDAQNIETGQKFVLGGGARVRSKGMTQQTTNGTYWNLPFSNQEAEFIGLGGHLELSGSNADPDANTPTSGVFVDSAGVGIYPVWPGPSVVVAQNQLIQPAAVYAGWPGANTVVFLPSPGPWFANSPFPYNYIIQPVNNNAGNFFYRVGLPANAVTGPGFSGATEPNPWNQTVGGAQNDGTIPCVLGACGIQWTNIGTWLPNHVIVPTVGNPGGYAFQVTTGGKTGSIQPAAWNQSVNGTTIDGTVTWTNVGVYTTNPNLFYFKATTGGTTGASMPVLTQSLNGTTTDGTVTWTTTLPGVNGSFTDLILSNFAFISATVNQSPVLLFNPAGVAGTVPAVFFDCEDCGPLSAGPSPSFPVSPISTVMSYDGGSSTNAWPRQFIIHRRVTAAGDPGQDDVERLQNHAFADMQHNDLTGKATAFGQLKVNQIPTPVSQAGTCNVPAWVANQGIAANYTIKPAVGKNAGNFFFQNQGGACVAGATEPNPWNQTPGGTQADGTCTYTNVNDGTGVASSTNAGVYYIKYTERVGLPNATQGETLPIAERTVNCGPTTSQSAVNISFTFPTDVGADSVGFYVSLTTGTETLAMIVPVGTDASQRTYRFPVNLIVPPDWAATTVYNQFTVILPTSHNVGNFYYMASKGGASGAVRPAAFNQTIGTLTADSSESWLNVGLGSVPASNATGQTTLAGVLNLNGSTSGTAIVAVPAAAGTPKLTLETVSGTVPVIQAQATPGASPTAILRMTGGGPGTANQDSWMPITLPDGSTGYVPIWK